VAGAEVGGLCEVVVAGFSFVLMAIEKYEVRYSIPSSLGDPLAESHSLRSPGVRIRFTGTRVAVEHHSSLEKTYHF
jgi:hypothetical protein